MEFLQAFLKRGLVNIPRMLFDYSGDLGLDYDTIGRIYAVMACVGGPGESSFESYTIARGDTRDYDQVRRLIEDLEQKEVVLTEEASDKIVFTFAPLFFKLRAIWEHYREQHDADVADGAPHPAVSAAEKVLGRPLSHRDVADILEWIQTYGFETEMVLAICREGFSQGVTRMSYLNQIALQWFEEGIRSPEEAAASAQKFRKVAGKHRPLIQYLGLKRQLTGAEQALLEKWTGEWGYSNEVIMRACDQAAGSNNPVQYINRVLETWRERGVKTVEDVERALSDHRRRPAAAGETAGTGRTRSKPPAKSSNVFLKREKKDEGYYDYLYKKFGE